MIQTQETRGKSDGLDSKKLLSVSREPLQKNVSMSPKNVPMSPKKMSISPKHVAMLPNNVAILSKNDNQFEGFLVAIEIKSSPRYKIDRVQG